MEIANVSEFLNSLDFVTKSSEHGFVLCASQAHLVAAFEKSLSNMTCRLQSLTMTAEQKVQELSSERGCELHGNYMAKGLRGEK